MTKDNALITSICRIIECFLDDYRETEVKKVTVEELESLEDKLNAIFIFALTWSYGCTGDYDSRKKMDLYIRKILKELTDKYEIPTEENGELALIFDY